MDLAKVQGEIHWLFSIFASTVETRSMVGAYDMNHYAETMLIELFSEIYGYEHLRNLNTPENRNQAAIDLGDDVARVALQITSDRTSGKIKQTLQGFVDKNLHEKYDHLIVYIITKKQDSYSGRGFDEIIQGKFRFDKDQDIRDYHDLIRIIDTYQIDKARRIRGILQANLRETLTSLIPISTDPITTDPSENPTVIISAQSNIGSSFSLLSPNLQNALSLVVNEFTQRPAAPDVPQPLDPVEASYRTQIELARDWVQKGQIATAHKILLTLYGNTAAGSANLRFDVVNLLGICELEMDNAVAAHRYFQEALQQEPASWKALINDSMATLIMGQSEEALRLSTQAYMMEPANPAVIVAHAQALHKADHAAELTHFLEQQGSLSAYPSGTTVLAIMQIDAGNYADAEVLLREALAKTPGDSQLYLLLAQALTEPLRTILGEKPRDSSEVQGRLSSAEDALSQAVTLATQGDNPVRVQTALLRRASVRRAADALVAALQDCEQVLAYNSTNLEALDTKARILLDLNRIDEAIRHFELLVALLAAQEIPLHSVTDQSTGLSGDSRFRQAKYFLGLTYLEAQRPEKVVALIDTSELESTDESVLGYFEILLGAYTQLHQDAGVQDIIQRMEQMWSANAMANAILAEYFLKAGDFVRVGNLLQAAIQLTDGEQQRTFKLQLAYVRFRQGDYSEAVSIYRPLVDRSCNNAEFRQFIISLYKAQQFSEAMQYAHELRQLVGPLPTISAIEASLLEQGGNLDKAYVVWRQLIDMEPDNVENKIQLAWVEFRRLNVEDAKQIVLDIPYNRVKDDPAVLLRLARLRLMLGIPGVLEYAHRALRLDYDNPETHVAYMTICFELHGPEADRGWHAPDTVAVNTSVHLKHGRDTVVFTILEDGPIHRDRGEMLKDDPRAQKLLGHHKGETVILDDGFLTDAGHEITEIQTKYIYASYQSTRLFGSGVLQHPSFQVVNVEEPRFIEQFMQYLDQRDQQAPDIQSLYFQKHLPLSMLASAINRPLIDLWISFVEDADLRIKVAIGAPEETTAHEQLLDQTTTVVLDLTTILTIVNIDAEAVIAERFATLLIGQSSVDELRQYQHNLATNRPSAIAGSTQGQPYFIELPASYFEQRLQLVQKALAFISTSVQVVSTMAIIDVDERILQLLGYSAVSSCLLAQERGVPLYADDLHLRILAQNQWEVAGFDTQALLREMYRRELLTRESYYSRLLQLAKANYSFLRLDVDPLMWVLERSNMTISEDVQNMFRPLRDPNCTVDASARVLAKVIKRVWIGAALDHQKLNVLIFILDMLTAGRRSSPALDFLRDALIEEFRLILYKLVPIFKAIEIWQQTRLN